MEKPKPKKEIAVLKTLKEARVITVYATSDAIEDLKDFGQICPFKETNQNLYNLWVDARYNFDEVLKYIEEYN